MRFVSLLLVSVIAGSAISDESKAPGDRPLELVVMDPLCSEMACDCVEGYAQRDYEKLAAFLSEQSGLKFQVFYAESFDKAIHDEGVKHFDLVVGKDSVVRTQAKKAEQQLTPVASLTGADGSTTQHGLFVVRDGNPAKQISDLKGYTILFGPNDCDEKWAAPRKALQQQKVVLEEKPQTVPACSDGAKKLMEVGVDDKFAAVISSYAQPLLEGCGTVKKGDLRVVGRTEKVPFVAAFVSSKLDEATRTKVAAALDEVQYDINLLLALQSEGGFVKYERNNVPKARPTSWSGWRGPNRDGLVALPKSFPDEPQQVWSEYCFGKGLAGIAATDEIVVLAESVEFSTGGIRERQQRRMDYYRCLDADTGGSLWTGSIEVGDAKELDYGPSPRATPLIDEDRVYVLGAYGDLAALDIYTGQPVWKKNLLKEFGGELPEWGFSNSPLIVDDQLIVATGSTDAFLAAIDPATGSTLWKSPGRKPAYSSFVAADIAGKRQIIGYDEESLGGWDAANGERLWEVIPPRPNDFNVPTPIVLGDKLLVTTENNGTRLYSFDEAGRIRPEPIAENHDLAPDTSTPVVTQDHVFGVWGEMMSLNLGDDLKTEWIESAPEYESYASVVASDDRVLVTTTGGELILLDAAAGHYQPVSRFQLPDDGEVTAHPAIVGGRVYVRNASTIYCYDLGL